MGYTVAVVGAGLVGEKLVSELRRREFPADEIRILARTARTTTPAISGSGSAAWKRRTRNAPR